MRLADFIESNYEPILAEWVAYAETCGPAGGSMDLTGLRDHALQMLQVIVADLRTRRANNKLRQNIGVPCQVDASGMNR